MSDVIHEWTVGEGEGRRRKYRVRYEHRFGMIAEASIDGEDFFTPWSASYVVPQDLASELANRNRLARIAEECIDHLGVLHDDRPILDALGLKIGDELHNAIPNLIALAKECLERRSNGGESDRLGELSDLPYALVVKPCPACNSRQLTIDTRNVFCCSDDCGLVGPYGETLIESVAKWNSLPRGGE